MRRKANYALLYMLASMQYVFGAGDEPKQKRDEQKQAKKTVPFQVETEPIDGFAAKAEALCANLTPENNTKIIDAVKEYIRKYKAAIQPQPTKELGAIEITLNRLKISMAWDKLSEAVLYALEDSDNMDVEEKLKAPEDSDNMDVEEKLKELCKEFYNAYKHKTEDIIKAKGDAILSPNISDKFSWIIVIAKNNITTEILSDILNYKNTWEQILQDTDLSTRNIHRNKTRISMAWNDINLQILTFLKNNNGTTRDPLLTVYKDLNEFSKEYFAAYKARCPQPKEK